MSEGYMEVSLRIAGAEIIGFRIAVDDFKTKWAIIGLGFLTFGLYAAETLQLI